MLLSNWIRWSGLAAVLGGAFSILFAFVGEDSRAHVPLDAARYAFLLVGIVGIYLYLRRSERFGLLGRVGFYTCAGVFALVAILDLGIMVSGAVEQWYISAGPVRGPLLILGLLLFGVATLRARTLPGGGAWLLIAAALTNLVAVFGIIASGRAGDAVGAWIFIVPTVLFGLGWGWIGYDLWSRRGKPAPQLARAG